MLSCTGKRSHRHTILHVSFGNIVFGLASARPTPQGLSGAPVFEPGKDKPLRKHEPLGRFITTPIFDKNSSGRTLANGKAYYRPKRDANGIIMCRSQKDQEACIFADKVRDLRQHEYDNQSLYTDSEAEQAAQNERSKCDFIKYSSFGFRIQAV